MLAQIPHALAHCKVKGHIGQLNNFVALDLKQSPTMRFVSWSAGHVHVAMIGKRAHVRSVSFEAVWRCQLHITVRLSVLSIFLFDQRPLNLGVCRFGGRVNFGVEN